MFLTKLHQTIKYKGKVWYYAGRSIPDDNSEIYYQYCTFPTTKNNFICGRTKNIEFINFRFKMQLRKKGIVQRTPEQIKKDIFNQITSYRKKYGISAKMV